MRLQFRNANGVLLARNQRTREYMAKHTEPVIEFNSLPEDVGSHKMRNTWFKWMGEIAEHYQVNNIQSAIVNIRGDILGYRPFTSDDAHELCCHLYLGSRDGERLSWNMSGEENAASRLERLVAMDKVVVMATEQGIKLTIPREGEYWNYREAQEQ